MSRIGQGPHNDFHRWLLDRWGPGGEAVYMFVLGFVAIAINGFAAYLLKQPLLFPSLAPTVFLLFRNPLSKDASPRNTLLGHGAAILIGFGCLVLFGLYDNNSVLREGVAFFRIWAVALSLALTEATLIALNRPHTPAATTVLLVSLGIFATVNELISLAAGIVLVVFTCWILNRSLGVPVPLWSPKDE